MATTCLAHPDHFTESCVPHSGGSRYLPPPIRTGSGFFRRRFCRIFPSQDLWVMQMERGGWPTPADANDGSRTFPTLTAAIAHAVDHGYTYRVVHVPDVVPLDSRRPLPRVSYRRGADRRQAPSTS